jgi:hypothetical protein
LAEIDFRYWASLDRWNAKEAALLMDGKNPDDHRDISLRSREIPKGYENAVKISKILDRVNWEQRYGKRAWEVKDNPIYIADALRSSDFPIPQALFAELKRRWQRENAAAASEVREAGTSAATKERQTMLKLIIGLACGGYSMDPEAPRNRHAKTMREDLERAGVPLDDDTIKKYLDEAKRLRRDLLARRGPI